MSSSSSGSKMDVECSSSSLNSTYRGAPIAKPVNKSSPKLPPQKQNTCLNSALVDATMLISISGVSCYRIDGDIPEAHLLETGTLQLLELLTPQHAQPCDTVSPSKQEQCENATLIATIDTFRLALHRNVPCLEMSCGANGSREFLFPTDATRYALVIPSDASADIVEVLRLILLEHTAFSQASVSLHLPPLHDDSQAKTSAAAPSQEEELSSDSLIVAEPHVDLFVKVGSSVAKGLDVGSAYLSSALVNGAETTGSYIQFGSEFLKTKILPVSTPVSISDSTRARLAAARTLSTSAVKISKTIVSGAVAATMAISAQLSDAFSNTPVGSRIVNSNSSPRVETAKGVARSALIAFVNVWEALEKSGFALLNSVGGATANIVQHRYGEESGAAARELHGIVTDVADSTLNIKRAGVKSLVKRTARNAAMDALSSEEEKQELRQQAHIDPLTAMQALSAVGQLSNLVNPVQIARAVAATPSQSQVAAAHDAAQRERSVSGGLSAEAQPQASIALAAEDQAVFSHAAGACNATSSSEAHPTISQHLDVD